MHFVLHIVSSQCVPVPKNLLDLGDSSTAIAVVSTTTFKLKIDIAINTAQAVEIDMLGFVAIIGPNKILNTTKQILTHLLFEDGRN